VKPFLLPELEEVRGLTHHSPAVSLKKSGIFAYMPSCCKHPAV
jgi:hypothetical protein